MNRWSRSAGAETERKVKVRFTSISRDLTYACDDDLWRDLRIGCKVCVTGLLTDEVGIVTGLYSDYPSPYECIVAKAVTRPRSYRVICTTGALSTRSPSLKALNVIAEDHEDALRHFAQGLGDFRGKLYAVVDDPERDDARHFTVDVAPPVQTPGRIDINPTHSR